VVIRQGRIVGVGPSLSLPPGIPVVSGEGAVVTAGFWNAHVHFTEPKWRASRRGSATVLNAQLREMLTSRGFTSVVDTGSDPRITLPLRGRIEAGELLGPCIYTSGSGIFPPRGIPYYLRDTVPFWIRFLIPQPSRPAAAEKIVHRSLARGVDLVKLFTGSYVARGEVRAMPEPIARAAVQAAHAQGRPVFSHPSNLEGTRVAIGAGVDVLAHPPDTTAGIDDGILRRMVERGMGMIPTLKMFADTVVAKDPQYLESIYSVVRRFRALGGELLFGTDVGYMPDYATDDEFRALAASGLDARGVLGMLTTGPAGRFGVSSETGTVEVGRRADLTLLEGDPREDLLAFARVRATIRSGRVLYDRG
jgi:imidazolonepropionase-like amidohydrolase